MADAHAAKDPSQTQRIELEDELRYPIGKFHFDGPCDQRQREAWIAAIELTPGKFRAAVSGLSPAQLDTPYRPAGWTVRQVAHHVPDSHLNAYIRFKWALTEDDPAIKAYDEKLWAQTPEVAVTPVEVSMSLLGVLHQRWVTLLRAMKPEDFARTLRHPDADPMTLDRMLGLYAWHGRHHTAHVTALRERMGW